MVHILTHTDLDGYSAGYVVLQHFADKECTIDYFNYDKEPAIENYKKGDTVVITDYSLSNDQYRQILDFVGDEGDVIWLDHHITAINRYNEASDICLQGIRSTKWCGAALAWFYFNTDLNTDDLENKSYEELVEILPLWLRLVDAWDTWKTNSPYRTNAEYLNIGIQDELSIDNISCIAKNVYDYYLLRAINNGKTYTKYRNNWAKSFRDKYMFKKTISGNLFGLDRDVTLAVLNIGCANSTYFGDVINEVDACVTMCFNGTSWIVSLYSNKDDIDCSRVAKHFGGGGHKGAAGCSFEQLTPPAFVFDKR